MIDTSKPVCLAGIPSQTGKIDGTIIGGFAYVRWDDGGGNSVDVERLMQVEGK